MLQTRNNVLMWILIINFIVFKSIFFVLFCMHFKSKNKNKQKKKMEIIRIEGQRRKKKLLKFYLFSN